MHHTKLLSDSGNIQEWGPRRLHGFDLEANSRTNLRGFGIGLGLEEAWRALALTSKMPGLGLNLELEHLVLEHISF